MFTVELLQQVFPRATHIHQCKQTKIWTVSGEGWWKSLLVCNSGHIQISHTITRQRNLPPADFSLPPAALQKFLNQQVSRWIELKFSSGLSLSLYSLPFSLSCTTPIASVYRLETLLFIAFGQQCDSSKSLTLSRISQILSSLGHFWPCVLFSLRDLYGRRLFFKVLSYRSASYVVMFMVIYRIVPDLL